MTIEKNRDVDLKRASFYLFFFRLVFIVKVVRGPLNIRFEVGIVPTQKRSLSGHSSLVFHLKNFSILFVTATILELVKELTEHYCHYVVESCIATEHLMDNISLVSCVDNLYSPVAFRCKTESSLPPSTWHWH